MKPGDRALALKRSRRLLRGSRIATLTVLVAGPASTVVAVWVNQVFTAIVIVMTWLPAVALAAIFQASLVCPYCGKPFFRSQTRRRFTLDGATNLFATHCAHCHHPTRT